MSYDTIFTLESTPEEFAGWLEAHTRHWRGTIVGGRDLAGQAVMHDIEPLRSNPDHRRISAMHMYLAPGHELVAFDVFPLPVSGRIEVRYRQAWVSLPPGVQQLVDELFDAMIVVWGEASRPRRPAPDVLERRAIVGRLAKQGILPGQIVIDLTDAGIYASLDTVRADIKALQATGELGKKFSRKAK